MTLERYTAERIAAMRRVEAVDKHRLDHNTLHGAYNGFDGWPVQYVHATAGSDANAGKRPGEAKATIEAAYGDLDADGGVILLSGGPNDANRHDVGDGLSLTRTKEAVIKGVGRWQRYHSTAHLTYPGTEPVIYSSTGASTLIDFALPVALSNGSGFEFSQLAFELSATTDIALDMNSVTQPLIDNVFFWSKNASAIGVKSYHDDILGNDHSWGRIKNGNWADCMLLDLDGGNSNQWIVKENVGFGTSVGMTISNAHRCAIRDNNIENFATGILIDGPSWGNEFTGNGGENVDVFYDVINGKANLFTGPGISTAGAGDIFIRFSVDSPNNVVVAPGRLSPGGTGSRYLGDDIIDLNGTNTIITGLQVETPEVV